MKSLILAAAMAATLGLASDASAQYRSYRGGVYGGNYGGRFGWSRPYYGYRAYPSYRYYPGAPYRGYYAPRYWAGPYGYGYGFGGPYFYARPGVSLGFSFYR
jgi:hypothetical protein